MNKTSDTRKSILLIALFSILCFPVLLAPPNAWLNLALLIGGLLLPFLIVGILINKRILSQNPYMKFALAWLAGGLAFFLLSSIVLILSNYAWQNVISISTKFGAIAMAISLLWYLLSIAIKKFFSSIRQ